MHYNGIVTVFPEMTRSSKKWIRILSLFILFVGTYSVYGEGTRQLEPTNPSTTTNRRTKIMFDQTGGSAHRTPFATINCAERYRLNVYISDPASEQIYFGFNDGSNTLYYQVKDPDGLVVTGFNLSQVPSSGVGFINTWEQAYAGPKIGTINPTGYDPKILTPTKVGNYYFEFAPTLTGGNFTGQDMTYFDISVVQGTTVKNGRLWSKAWQLSDAASGDLVLSYPVKLYIYTDDGIVTQLNINEWNGGTYTTYCNQYGVANTNNWGEDRMSSTSWPGSDLPQYKIFLNNPDVLFFPTGSFGEICEVISHSKCDGSVDIMTRVNKPGSLTLNLDVLPLGPGPEDVAINEEVNGSPNCDVWDTISWNGLDGNGNPVANGTHVTIDIDYLNGLTNLPLWDVEDNVNGLIVNLIRPAPVFSSKVPVFWDDSNIPGGSVNSINGCIYPSSINVSGCHSWSGQDENMINTWWYLSEGSSNIEIMVIRSPEVNFTFENTCSGDETQFTDMTVVPSGYPVYWKWTFGLFGDTSNLQNPAYIFSNSGTYNVNLRVTSNFGCSGQVNKLLAIHQGPVAEAGSNKVIPYNSSTTLDGSASNGSGSYTYHWEPANLLLNPDIPDPTTMDLTETTDFELRVTDTESLCQHSDQMTVTIIGGPLGIQLSSNPQAVCKGNTSFINAQIGGGSGTYTYSWSSDPPGFTSNLEDVTVQPFVSTTYYLEVNDGYSTLTQSITIGVHPDPLVNAGSPQTIAYGTSTMLSGSATSGTPPYSYQWSPSSMVLLPGQSNTPTAQIYTTTNFTLSVTDANGCEASSGVLVSLSGGPLQVYPQAQDATICYGESTTLMPMSEGGSGSYSYTWSSPDGFQSNAVNPSVTPGQTTTYHLMVNDGYNTSEGEVTVYVNPLPVIDLIPAGAHVLSQDTILACVFDTLVISAGNTNSSYLWSNGAVTAEILTATTGIAFDMLTYSVQVENNLTGCINTATITIIFTYGECSYSIDEGIENIKANVYPNPGTGDFTCEIPPGDFGELTVLITDPSGREIWHSKLSSTYTDSLKVKMDLNAFPSGIYFVRILGKNYSSSARMLKF